VLEAPCLSPSPEKHGTKNGSLNHIPLGCVWMALKSIQRGHYQIEEDKTRQPSPSVRDILLAAKPFFLLTQPA